MSKVPKITCLQYLSNMSRKTWRKSSIFCLQVKIKGFFKLIISYQITQITSLLFLCNILRKKCVMKLIFSIQIIMKYKLMLWFLMGMIKHFQSSKNSKSEAWIAIWHWFFACRWTSEFLTSWFQHFGHQSVLQGDTIFDAHYQAFSK